MIHKHDNNYGMGTYTALTTFRIKLIFYKGLHHMLPKYLSLCNACMYKAICKDKQTNRWLGFCSASHWLYKSCGKSFHFYGFSFTFYFCAHKLLGPPDCRAGPHQVVLLWLPTLVCQVEFLPCYFWI